MSDPGLGTRSAGPDRLFHHRRRAHSTMDSPAYSRRNFLFVLPGAVAGMVLGLRPQAAQSTDLFGADHCGPDARLALARKSELWGFHPDPRPGIDASGIIPREELEGLPENIIAIYDMVREMPHIADGLGCYCGCSVLPGYRSLLTCYHPEGMAMGCNICQGQAKLAHRRFKEGQDLERIRRALDARYG